VNDGDWRRLHPLSPVVRGGRATIAIAILLLPTVFGGRRDPIEVLVQLAIVGLLVVLGFVSWLVTRWRIDDDDVLIETGLIRRRSLRFPLAQLQSVDIVRPGLARLVGVAELRLRMGGATGDTGRLAYLGEREVEPLRLRLLALAGGAAASAAGTPAAAPPEERPLTTVPTARLAASILISDVGMVAELVAIALIAIAAVSPAAAEGLLSVGLVWVVGVGTLVWRRFNQEYRLTVADSKDGLRVHSGLIALTAETIRPGRVQAVRMVEPLLWRRLGWCRLEVDVAGRQRSKGEGQAQRGRLRTVLPVGSRSSVEELLDRLVPERPALDSPPPQRARWKSPLRYRMLRVGRSPTCVATMSGRLRRVTCWVPLEKAQSFREVQGPLQRRLRLATVHVDTAGRGVRATLRDRDVAEANAAVRELPELARVARRRSAGRATARRPVGAAAAPGRGGGTPAPTGR
jgi:putative membrane protein